LILFLWL